MPRLPHSLLSYLRVVAGAWRDDPREDAELLTCFADSGDEAAFKALVYRHGPLVWRSCTRVLGDGPDAEDAFQTAFLALAHKAGRLRREPLAGWLHRVARQSALKVDVEARRRRNVEQHLRTITQPEATAIDRAELYAALDEELAGLPERLRVPLLLHYLEGRSQDEVAHFLGCSRAVVRKRLARGEAILRKRLIGRGLEVFGVAALLTSSVAVSAVPARLVGNTARAAVAFRSGTLTGGAAEAARAVLGALPASIEKTIMWKSLWIVLACSLGLAGAGLVTCRALSARPDELGEASPATAQAPREPETDGGAVARVDCFGDPLPPLALARMGTVRLWQGGDRVAPKALVFSPDGRTLATESDGRTVCLWDAATGKEIHRLTTKAAKGPIVSLSFSPNGKTLIAMDYDQTVFWWKVATGKFFRKQEYQGPKRDNVQSLTIAFLSDGQMLGFGDFLKSPEEGRGAYVWDVATGKEICQLSEPTKKRKNPITVKAFSPDGKLLATNGDRKNHTDRDKTIVRTTIHLWDVVTGKEIRQLIHEVDIGQQTPNGYADVDSVVFSRDGKTLASSDGQQICVLEVATGKPIHRLKAAGGFYSPLTFSPDGKSLVGGSAGHFFDVGTGKEIRSFGCEDAKVALFSPNGKVLAMGDEAGAIRLWEVATGKEIGPRKGYRGRIRSVTYSPDGKTLASMGWDGTVRRWEPATGKEMRPLAKHGASWAIQSLAYSPDGKMLISMDNVLHLWDTATSKEIRQFRGWNPWSATFSPDGKKLAASASCGRTEVSLWEVATGKEIYSLPAGVTSGIEPWSVTFSPDGRLLAVPGKDNTVSLWEAATGQPIGQLVGPKHSAPGISRFVRFLAFSPDGRILATSSMWDEKIRLWEVASGTEIWQLNGLKNYQRGYTLAFSPDGRMLATAARGANPADGSTDSKVHLWEVASGKEIGQLSGHQSFVRSVAFSPDGKTLASGSDDLTCLIWDLTSVGRPALSSRILSREQLEAVWADLANDPVKAYGAIRVLQAVPTQATTLLQARVRPVAPADPQQLKRWIADLDDNRFAVRDKAQQEIAKMGEPAIPALRQALKGQPALEVKRRLQDLLARLEPRIVGGPPERMREPRAVQVLEFIGTAEARQLLQAWAKGVTGARLTMEARAALARLAKRPAASP